MSNLVYLKDNKDNSLHLARKNAGIFLCRHYLFRDMNSFPRVGFNPLSPGEKLYFSKMKTVNQKTTSNIPVERYCLVLNHHNRHTRCHKLNWGVRKVKNWKRSKIPYSLYILGIPLDNSLICSSVCGDVLKIFTSLSNCKAQKSQKLEV